MKAEIIKLTPEIAKRLLDKNTANRKKKDGLIELLVSEMKRGLWKENGESIIIDKNGIVKDGQHRLISVIEANHSYNVPLITDVNPDVFDSIDTGKPRSVGDIFYINNVPNSTNISSIARSIFSLENSNMSGSFKNGNFQVPRLHLKSENKKNLASFSNGEIYGFYIKNKKYIDGIFSEAQSLYKREPIKIVGMTLIGVFLHLLKRFNEKKCHQITEFTEEVIGINTTEGNGANFVYKKLLAQKQDRIVYQARYIYHMFLRAWNDYQSGDPIIKSYYRINIKDELPKPDLTNLIWE